MKVNFKIIGAKGKIINDELQGLSIDIEYAVSCSDLYIAYLTDESFSGKERKQCFKKIDHILYGNVKHKHKDDNLEFNVTIGVIIPSDEFDFEHGYTKMGIYYFIIDQDSNNGNYFLDCSNYYFENQHNNSPYRVINIKNNI